jgi:hypothetical protein
MPNHVKNVWKIKNIKTKDINTILNKLATKDDASGNYIIDFNLIIPEPQRIQDCPEAFRLNKDSHVMPYEDRPWFNWYEWHLKYWGTKWNAYDGYAIIGKSYITFVFNTAWSCPIPIIEQLAKMLDYDINIKFADEDYGSNCGKLHYDKSTHQWTEELEHEMKNPRKFARNLWYKY